MLAQKAAPVFSHAMMLHMMAAHDNYYLARTIHVLCAGKSRLSAMKKIVTVIGVMASQQACGEYLKEII